MASTEEVPHTKGEESGEEKVNEKPIEKVEEQVIKEEEAKEKPVNSNIDEVDKLKAQLRDTEEKLIKFKKFAISVRNERDQLSEKVTSSEAEIEKLRQELKKQQTNKNYQQLFQNFQNLQSEYDKQVDIIEDGKRKNKALEIDILKCSEEQSHCKNQIADQIEEINQLKSQSQAKDSQILSLQSQKQDLESRIIVLQQEFKNDKKQTNELQSNQLEEYEKRNVALQEINETLHRQLTEKSEQLLSFEDTEARFADLNQEFEVLKSKNKELESCLKDLRIKSQSIDNEKHRFEQELNSLSVKHSQKCLEFEHTVSEYKRKLQCSEDDMKECNSKFEQYKTKVANVLKNGKLNNAETDKVIEEMRFENERAVQEIEELKTRCAKSANELASSSRVIMELQQNLKESEGHFEMLQSTKTRLNELQIENTRLNSQIEQSNLSSLKERESIQQSCNIKIEEIKQKYEKRVRDLEHELENALRHPSPVCVNALSPAHVSDTESVNNSVIHSFVEINGREDISQQSSNNSNSERNFLEDILNNDSSDNQSIDLISASEIENLTQMLGDSENNIHLLSEQNRVLKEEIRRLTKNIERMDIADNLEYLKNVLLKFMTIPKVDERERLITVLTTILKLTNEERRVFADAIQNGQSTAGNSKWALW